ncbi:MAG: ECF-type sigma factor [Phycisphaerales bacterium]|nr:sigma-70 family RNA polymerase sigma factor [Planctomycetota bacterium]
MSGPSDELPASGAQNTPADSDRAFWITTLYSELRALAQSALDSERVNHTLSATALVNETYLKLTSASAAREMPRLDRATFFPLAAQAMRRILVDHARGKQRQKRGGGRSFSPHFPLDLIADQRTPPSSFDAVDLDQALSRLALEHEQAARVVELRFFAGLADPLIAEILHINERTVRRHWTFARAWLSQQIGDIQNAPDNPAEQADPP